MAKVDLLGVEKRFPDGTHALKPLHLSLADGELLVLLGPSGCGKSTLLRMVAGLEEPSSGDILIDGQVVNRLSPRRRNVAMVFQNYALYPHMTVRANLEFPLRMLKFTKQDIRKRVDEVAGTLELTALLDRKPGELSGGQGQRVAMGRAMVRDPAVFLMDEPLSNLDAKLRLQIRNEIAALQKRMHSTMLYVTHDQVEAMTLGMRVALLRDGELQQVGTPQALYREPVNLFVAGFLGSPAMNIFPANVTQQDGQWVLSLGAQNVPLGSGLTVPREGVHLGGLRPEAFFWPERVPQLPSLEVEVTLVETLGHEQIVYFKAPVAVTETEAGYGTAMEPSGRGQMAARLPTDRGVGSGDKIRIAIDPAKLHWFDNKGKALDAGG